MGAIRPEIIKTGSGNSGNRVPNLDSSAALQAPLVLDGAVHPVIRGEVESRGGCYQPVSIDIDSSVSVITGPNMGGKTVALATVGLCVAMAQWGLMVPCKSMKFSLYDFCLLYTSWLYLICIPTVANGS